MNKPKRIGTASESAVRNFLVGEGWGECHRVAQTGAKDQGDLLICDKPFRVIAECKAGAMAESASAALIDAWLDQTLAEKIHAAAAIGVLVVRRYRRNVSAWDVYLPLKDLVWLEMGQWGGSNIPVRMSLADFSELLQFAVDEHEAGER